MMKLPSAAAEMPLFTWAACRERAAGAGTYPRIIQRCDLLGADGQPRICLDLPGRRVPPTFLSTSAALAAFRTMEAGHG